MTDYWNPSAAPPVSAPVKKLILFAAVFLLTTAVFAADEKEPAAPPAPPLGAKAEAMIEQLLPVCSEAVTLKRAGLRHGLPANMTGNAIQIDAKRSWCSGQWVAIVSKEGGFYIGIPWFLDDMKGTVEEKLKTFAWQNMQQSYAITVDHTKTRDGLYRVTMTQTTEHGKLPLEGEVDPAGTVLFIGHFMPLDGDGRASRTKVLSSLLDKSPATGAADPQVTVIEFSDFECPSCQRAAGYMKPILAAHPDKVRYVRFDMPLITIHPWAFSAAVAGRAIFHQKPELFWTFKEHIYENQDKLNNFAIDDFVRGFAQDHDLDLKRFDADIASPQTHAEILSGLGLAFSADVRATPTYLVNGVNVDPGTDGKALADYVEKALKAPATPSRETPSKSGR
jgi:protein-disulfide isomerase